MDIANFKEARRLIQQGNDMLRSGSFDYYLDKMLGCYELLLDRFSPFKVGDRVILAKTPNITPEKSWGWMGSKHFLIKGAAGTVRSVSVDRDGFSFQVEFDDESFIHPFTKQVTPVTEKHTYHFGEDWLVKATQGKRDE